MTHEPNTPLPRDPQTQRARLEWRLILALVGAVLLIALGWRLVTGEHGGPEKGWGPSRPSEPQAGAPVNPAAGAGVPVAPAR